MKVFPALTLASGFGVSIRLISLMGASVAQPRSVQYAVFSSYVVSVMRVIHLQALTTYDAQQAYWTERVWAIDAPIKIASRIDTPKPLSETDAGTVVVGGVAWAQGVGIDTVEVRIDGNAWQPAKLGPQVSDDYWRQWYLDWDAEPGQHTLAARALDENGEPQSPARATPFPDGASGVQSIVVTVA